jgi:hypothetical protein
MVTLYLLVCSTQRAAVLPSDYCVAVLLLPNKGVGNGMLQWSDGTSGFRNSGCSLYTRCRGLSSHLALQEACQAWPEGGKLQQSLLSCCQQRSWFCWLLLVQSGCASG